MLLLNTSIFRNSCIILGVGILFSFSLEAQNSKKYLPQEVSKSKNTKLYERVTKGKNRNDKTSITTKAKTNFVQEVDGTSSPKKWNSQVETPHFSTDPEVKFRNVDAYFRGDTLQLSFDLDLLGKVIDPTEALHIVPIYNYAGEVYPLQSILVNGTSRDRFYRREEELMSKEEYLLNRPSQIVVLRNRRPWEKEAIHYRATLLLPPSLHLDKDKSRLVIYQFLEDCCHIQEMGNYLVALNTPPKSTLIAPPEQPIAPRRNREPIGGVRENPTYVPVYAEAPMILPAHLLFYRPAEEQIKIRDVDETVRIQFRLDRSEILVAYKNNAAELRRAKQFLDPILKDSRGDIEVQNFSIKGYASPEGTFDHNLQLSQRRAETFRSFLYSMYGSLSKLGHFPAVGMGEDWDGLREAIEESSAVPQKEEVLAIIDFYSIKGGREKQLMDLHYGIPYKYLLEYFFPPLRRMVMEVSYKVRNYSPEEVEYIFDRRPQDLSQAEIFEVAQRRNTESIALNRFGLEYDIAAHYFPKDRIANLNASSAALIRGDLAKAWKYLTRIKGMPEAATNFALYYWMSGNYREAKRYLEEALRDSRQAPQAREFLKQLESNR